MSDGLIISRELVYDNVLEVTYHTAWSNAKILREYLLENLSKKGLEPLEYNSNGRDWYNPEKIIKNENPPIEIYEYQPFFLLKTEESGEYLLLDGFRRLLWYNAPDHKINVRIYDEKSLTPQKIMKLLVYLNHFKFYGSNGAYHDRGFALAMKTIFGLNIPKYRKEFDAYLSLNETVRKYWDETTKNDTHIELVKERMVSPMFISDMKFIESLVDTDIMLNIITASLIYKMRCQYPNVEFDSKLFINKVMSNKILKDLQERYKTVGDGTGARAQTVINQIIPLYENIFKEMFGGEVVKTYAEKKDECKKLLAELKKDKSFTKITGSGSSWIMTWIMEDRLADKIPIKYKCIVYPLELDTYNPERNNEVIKYGLLEYPIKFVRYQRNGMTTRLVLGIETEDGSKFEFSHNYSGGYGTGKQYTKLSPRSGMGNRSFDIDLFVDITSEEIKWRDEHRDRTIKYTKDGGNRN